jgi:hypothetical protein
VCPFILRRIGYKRERNKGMLGKMRFKVCTNNTDFFRVISNNFYSRSIVTAAAYLGEQT